MPLDFSPIQTQENSQTLESKAFYQSILYYLKEHLTHKNNNLTHIILTNYNDFYLIDAKAYLPLSKESAIKKAFTNHEKGRGNDTSTRVFYEELKSILPKLDYNIPYTHFSLESIPDASTLALIYQALSPAVLLKAKSYIDANTLNIGFYNELLYILGLEEISQNGKILIQPSHTKNTLLDSLCAAFELDRDKDFEEIFSLLMTWNNRILFLRLLESMLLSFEHIKKPFLDLVSLPNFQMLNTLFFDVLAKLEDKRDAGIPQALSNIPYLNSSLFDKTSLEIEGKEIKLLDSKPLKLYADSILYRDKTFCTHLKLNAQTKDSTLPLLEYFFAFLHAYNFTTTAKDIQNYTKTNYDKLINSAVLGLVFEKLNGYKEGSFYTPSFITRYMCKQSLEKVVLQKFNECKNWDCQNLEELKTRLDKLTDSKEGYKEANIIFDSIKLCDPAVGSGHFLVSALNEMIALKFELRILCDENNERLKDIDLKVINDEIVIRDSANALFAYTLPKHENIEAHKIQKALFSAKRKLIESCLFGVDINPNSCEITKLRLWIELLKYSYYKDIPNKRLETLPNIDINIKCGNSLVSNIALDMTKDSLIKELKRIANKNATLEFSAELATTANDLQNKLPKKIEEYKSAVNAYKNETNADFKELHKKTIVQCQNFIVSLFYKMSNEYRIFKENLANYLKNSGYYGVDEGKIKNQPLDSDIKKKLNDYIIAFNFHKTLEIPKDSVGFVEKELIELVQSLQKYENLKSNQSTFEWRFAFPEVLDSNGDFMGFDLVIGNPPYGVELTSQEREMYKKTYSTSQTNTAALFIYLSDKILSPQGINTLIVPKSLNYVAKWEDVREFIKPSMYLLADCGKAWSYVLLEMVIFARQKDNITQTYKTHFLEDSYHSNFSESEESQVMAQNQINVPMVIDKKLIEKFGGIFINGLSEKEICLGIKMAQSHYKLEKYHKNIKGCSMQSYLKEKGYYAYIGGKQINRFGIVSIKGFCDEKHNAGEILPNALLTQDIVAHITKPKNHIKIIACIPNREVLVLNTINQLVFEGINVKLAWAILNSNLINWYCYKFIFSNSIRTMHLNSYATNKIPIPKITKQNQNIADSIIALVDEILNLKAKDSTTDTSELESKINSLVYALYDLNEEEVKIIEDS